MAQRVDNEPSRLNVLEDVIKQAAVTGFQHETWRSADYSELTFIFYFSKIPTKVLRISIDLVWKLFEGHIDPGLSKTDPVDKILYGERCLSCACGSSNHHSVTGHEPTSEHLVKLDDSSLDPKTFFHSTGEQVIEACGSSLRTWRGHFSPLILTVSTCLSTNSRRGKKLA